MDTLKARLATVKTGIDLAKIRAKVAATTGGRTPIVIGYDEARERMRPGDVIAFSGKGDVSELIKTVTRSPVSHVAGVLQTRAVYDHTNRYFNLVVESTLIGRMGAVQTNRLSDRLAGYDGEVWWLPLSEETRQHFDVIAYFDFMYAQNGRPYDAPQAIKSALDLLDMFCSPGRLTHNREDFARFFCSELIAAGMEAAGVTGAVNCSEVTPIDLCRWSIYAEDYYLLCGRPDAVIPRYNSIDPSAWRG